MATEQQDVVVILSGGLVQEVFSDAPNLRIVVLDYDMDGATTDDGRPIKYEAAIYPPVPVDQMHEPDAGDYQRVLADDDAAYHLEQEE
jgi:hypothetical protein